MKNKKRIIGIICASLAIICIISGVILYIWTQPKNIFIDSLQKMSNRVFDINENKASNTLEQFLTNQEIYQMNLNSSININSSTININNLMVNMNYQVDQTNNKAIINCNLSNDETQNSSLWGIDAYLTENKLYYRIKDVMEKYYYKDINLSFNNNQTQLSNIKYLYDKIINSLERKLKHDAFKTGSTTINIANKNLKVKTITIAFTNKLLTDILKDVISSFENDQKALDILMTLTATTNEKDLKDILDNILDESTADYSSEEVLFTYEMDLKDTQVLLHKISIENEELIYSNYKNQYSFIYRSNDSNVVNLSVTKKNSNTYIIEGSLLGLYNIEGSYNKDNNKQQLSLNLMANKEQQGKVDLEIINQKEISNKQYTKEIQLDLHIADINISASTTVNGETLDKLPEIDVTDSIAIDDLFSGDVDNLNSELLLLPFSTMFMMAKSNNA